MNGDDLSVQWRVYTPGSHYSGDCTSLQVWNETSANTTFTIPMDAKPGDYFNLILEVSDGMFTRYGQIIISLPNRSFRDVLPDHEAFEAIENLNRMGIIGEVANACFQPDADVTIGDVMVALANIEGVERQFADVWASMLAGPYDGYDAWIAERGFLCDDETVFTTADADKMDGMIAATAAALNLTYQAPGFAANRAGLAVRLASIVNQIAPDVEPQ